MADEREWTTDDDAGCAPVERAVRALREPVAVRPEWRAAVLRDVARVPAPRRPVLRRAWHVTPLRAAAAAALCAGLGAGSAWWALRGAAGDAPVMASGATARTVAPAALPLVLPASARDGGAATAVRFTLHAPGAARVSVVGAFNRWDPDATPLRPLGDGTWAVSVPLPPGRHVYAFVVDGGVTTDPRAPRVADEDFGDPNSVVIVAESST